MKKELAEEWAAALKSGEYQQGTGGLRPELDKYCCLGVLCDLYIKNNPGKAQWLELPCSNSKCFSVTTMEQASDTPTRTVLEWAGLFDRNPTLTKDIGKFKGGEFKGEPITLVLSTLAQLNDSGEFNFNQIADIILDQHDEF